MTRVQSFYVKNKREQLLNIQIIFFFLVLVFEGKTRICTIGSKTSVSTSLASCTARMKLICCCLAPLHCSSSFQAFPDYYSYFFISFELLVGVCVVFFLKKGNRSEPMLAKRVNQVDQVVCLPEVELHFSASWNSRKFCALFPIIKIELYLNFQLSDNDLYVRISLSRFYFNLFTRIFSLVLFLFSFSFWVVSMRNNSHPCETEKKWPRCSVPFTVTLHPID